MKRVGVIGRFRPLHNGAAAMLESLCEQAEHVIIGIGSSEGEDIPAKYNVRNPFTPTEVEEMIHLFLQPRHTNYEVIHVPDFAHIPQYADGQKWRTYVREHFGELDCFVSGNAYVRNLLKDDYTIAHPAELIARERWVVCKGTWVRLEMARHGAWESLVPTPIAQYLQSNGLVDRFRREFGLSTLATLAEGAPPPVENLQDEYLHTRES